MSRGFWCPLSAWCVGLSLLAPVVGIPVFGEEPRSGAADEKPFVRLLRDRAEVPQQMQTSIVRYTRPKTKESEFHVDLVGAVHVGDQSYYRQLNKRFEGYEVVLYELVAPEGTRVPAGGGRGGDVHPVGMAQNMMKNVLKLEHQLELVDYQKANFVHADMSPEEFARSMADRGESFVGMMFRAMGASIAQQTKDPSRQSDLAIITALFNPNQGLALKRVMSEQLSDMEGAIGVFDGPDGSTIITERNKKALSVLSKQLEAGKTRIAIFYGAAHLPDMEQRLIKDFGLERGNIEWLTAWDMRDPERSGKSK